MKITCLTRNIADITTFQVLNPNGVAVSTTLGVYTVDNVTRDFAGVYTCIITNNMDRSTINATSTVVIQCELKSYDFSHGFKYLSVLTLDTPRMLHLVVEVPVHAYNVMYI